MDKTVTDNNSNGAAGTGAIPPAVPVSGATSGQTPVPPAGGGARDKGWETKTAPVSTGKAAFSAWMAANPNPPGTFAYYTYIVQGTAPGADAEYARLLHQEQMTALQRLQELVLQDFKERHGDPHASLMNITPEAQAANAESLTVVANTSDASDDAKMRKEAIAAFRRENTGVPMIKGLPSSEVGATAVLGQITEAPEGIIPINDDPSSQWVTQFVDDQSLLLGTTPEGRVEAAQAMSRNGQYVYVGQVEDQRGGNGFIRDVYVYVDSAQAGIAKMSDEEIKGYQAQLGLSQTGIVDPQIAALWDEAVSSAQRYAMAGRKVDLRFIFDTLVAQKAAEGGYGGGGGGGGGRSQTNDDYYFAMMQVLGDISGVQG